MFSLESPHRGDSNEYTQYTISQYEKEEHSKLFQSAALGFFPRDPRMSSNSRGKRPISVRATESLLYLYESMGGAVAISLASVLLLMVASDIAVKFLKTHFLLTNG